MSSLLTYVDDSKDTHGTGHSQEVDLLRVTEREDEHDSTDGCGEVSVQVPIAW